MVASASRFTAPVHIDVGGKIYTSSLDTLTRYLPLTYWTHLPGTFSLDTLTRYFLTRHTYYVGTSSQDVK